MNLQHTAIFYTILNGLDLNLLKYSSNSIGKKKLIENIANYRKYLIKICPQINEAVSLQDQTIARCYSSLFDISSSIQHKRKSKRLILLQDSRVEYIRGLLTGSGLI